MRVALVLLAAACASTASEPGPAAPTRGGSLFRWPAGNPHTVACPARFVAAKGLCSENGAETARCVYPEGTCSCLGPPSWQVGGCTGSSYLTLPHAFDWACTTAVREDGCPGEQPTAGTACATAKQECGYFDAHGCDGASVVVSCRDGRWN
jgi:hypothetical protein